MPKLNQILAIEKGTKARVNEKLTVIYKTLQKPELFSGHVKTYKPKDEDPTSPFGEVLPDDVRVVQAKAAKLLEQVAEAQTEIFDLSFARDVANTAAKADLVVDGVTILKDVPVPYLLWLEKQLNDLHSEVKRVPTLDPAEEWSWSSDQASYVSKMSNQARTKKVTVPLVLSPATDKHPAQVEKVTEDVRAGTWSTIKYSSALSVTVRDTYLKRVETLQKAVKQAREAANSIEVPKLESVGKKIFDFVFAAE